MNKKIAKNGPLPERMAGSSVGERYANLRNGKHQERKLWQPVRAN